MNIRFVGIDPETDEDGCPTVWVDMDTADLLIQSYEVDEETSSTCDALSPARSPIPPGETVIRIPRRMIPIIRKACDELDPGVR
ncbi:hypothetical protein Sipo8835_29435 [Streptomyces ipomoeae]|jgi:hypothetical protein|uniref:Uncharacterized protein n=2 Tax=Streptomyces ipomoeae TaxID=103232 RepID=L1KLK3_9ACTN|nr:hypothetical protein [Streptomyces ipomoeae]EKX61434.1 hypothetical protein STRIP9103_04192 [Streptomyces ipomoeae 91-03]MDX2697621.1 hypothetical protein [Streptomyces ipomoeae]MDX2825062.1 hypothetical protein [Streptomyces ipomoeae]MDX2843403.1 hypothetical protein [Streptomyces ipomoeae]MDX2877636.1 hypothetical protein [Streptomyces ipomoeae]